MTSSTHDRSVLLAQDTAATRARTDERVPCRSSDMRSIALAPLTETDKRVLRRIGREVRTFDVNRR